MDWVEKIGAGPATSIPLSKSVPGGATITSFTDRYMANKRNVLSGYDASEGVLYALFAAIITTLPNVPDIIAVDNVDSGLNPRLLTQHMAKICKWAVATPRQLLLTCHNPAALDGLPLQDDRIRLFTVDRSDMGQTVVRRVVVNEHLLQKAREGWPLSRLWLDGHIGGMPIVLRLGQLSSTASAQHSPTIPAPIPGAPIPG